MAADAGHTHIEEGVGGRARVTLLGNGLVRETRRKNQGAGGRHVVDPANGRAIGSGVAARNRQAAGRKETHGQHRAMRAAVAFERLRVGDDEGGDIHSGNEGVGVIRGISLHRVARHADRVEDFSRSNGSDHQLRHGGAATGKCTQLADQRVVGQHGCPLGNSG